MAQNKENEVGPKCLINLIFWLQGVQNTRHKNEILSNFSLIVEIPLWLFQTSQLYGEPASWNLWEQKFPVPFLLITLRKNLQFHKQALLLLAPSYMGDFTVFPIPLKTLDLCNLGNLIDIHYKHFSKVVEHVYKLT